jgi:hypothetical protein
LVIISFNYDLIVDIALAHRFRTDFAFDTADAARLTEQQEPLGIDYGVPFANMPPMTPLDGQFTLLKLHGSFNWLWSRVTGDLYFGGLNKTIALVFDELAEQALDLPHCYAGREHCPSVRRQAISSPS